MGPALIPFFACPVITNLQLYITMTRPLRIWLRDHICAPTNYVKLSLLSSHSKCMFSHVTFCVQMENRSSSAEYRCPSANCSTRDATDANYSSKHWRPALEDISSFLVDSRSQQIRLLLPPRFVKSPQQLPTDAPSVPTAAKVTEAASAQLISLDSTDKATRSTCNLGHFVV